jgi:hypothetical protein
METILIAIAAFIGGIVVEWKYGSKIGTVIATLDAEAKADIATIKADIAAVKAKVVPTAPTGAPAVTPAP